MSIYKYLHCNVANVPDPKDGELGAVGINGADNEGMLIMYTPLKTYQWSTICSTEWDDIDAQVACRQMGYIGGHSQAYRWLHINHFGGDLGMTFFLCSCLVPKMMFGAAIFHGNATVTLSVWGQRRRCWSVNTRDPTLTSAPAHSMLGWSAPWRRKVKDIQHRHYISAWS